MENTWVYVCQSLNAMAIPETVWFLRYTFQKQFYGFTFHFTKNHFVSANKEDDDDVVGKKKDVAFLLKVCEIIHIQVCCNHKAEICFPSFLCLM